MQRLGRNDLCWCGSGKKYKKCHLLRESESPLPGGAILNGMARTAPPPSCLHPSAAPNVCDKLVASHTIQRSRVLGRIIDATQHVLTFHSVYRKFEAASPERIGWRRASTIPGFCGIHDHDTFRPLEAGEFVASLQQCFLLGYRALCHEFHAKKAAASGIEFRRRIFDRGMTPAEQVRVQELVRAHQMGVRRGLEDLLAIKEYFDQALIASRFDACEAVAIEFTGALSLAASGTMTPDVDLDGTRLQVLHDASRPIEWLAIASDATAAGGAVVFCWRSGARCPRQFVDSLLGRGDKEILALLPQVLLFHIENTYFSSSWWASRTEEDQNHLRSLAIEPNPYYTARRFANRAFAPWQLKTVHDYRAA